MPRKSPHKHKVKEHTRQGRRIAEYERGKGKKPSRKIRRKTKKVVVGKKRGKIESDFTKFVFTIIYQEGKEERSTIKSSGYFSALDDGLRKRKRTDPPHRIRIRGVA